MKRRNVEKQMRDACVALALPVQRIFAAPHATQRALAKARRRRYRSPHEV